jgi:hypothetical protein
MEILHRCLVCELPEITVAPRRYQLVREICAGQRYNSLFDIWERKEYFHPITYESANRASYLVFCFQFPLILTRNGQNCLSVILLQEFDAGAVPQAA